MVIDLAIPTYVYPVLIWTVAWKAVGAWRSARDGNLLWFISFFIFNTFGVLPIVYLFFFRRVDFSGSTKKKARASQVPSSKAKKAVKRKKAPSLA